jgi:DNA-binding PadR family transcriptional regulator
VVAVAKRRRVNNLLALAVLSVVIQQPMHPYQMASLIRARGKDQDMRIKWGSLYTVVRNMEKHGLLEAVESSRQGSRPERTVYRLTDAGRAELEDWVRELVSVPEREPSRFEAGLSVVGVLPPAEVIVLLGRRLAALDRGLAEQREALALHSKEIPRMFLVEMEYDQAVRQAEAAWVRQLLDELTAGSLPGMAEWQQWHTTGEMSPELRELAERGSNPP